VTKWRPGKMATAASAVVAIYSNLPATGPFDQLIHDVGIQKLAGHLRARSRRIVAPDGPTHQGQYDITYSCAPSPHFTVMAQE